MTAAHASRGVHVPEGAGHPAAPGEGLPRASSAATRRISLGDMRRSVLACMEQGHLQPPFVSDVIALIDLAEIVKKRRARFNVKPYPGDWHKKSPEEEAMDALLEPFDA